MLRIAITLLLVLTGLCRTASAAAPLHVRIDKRLAEEWIGPASARCSDSEFVRRAYLDLTGVIPSLDEAREFLKDAATDKRERLIDRLLASDEHARHMTNVFDVMLMERRPDKHVTAAEWRKYLYESFLNDKPYDQLVSEVFAADGADPQMRAAAKFFLERDGEPHLVTRDAGRIVFGMDLQCAQCHDHPLYEDYLQRDYYGIFAFLNRSYVFADKKAKKSFIAEKAEGEVVKFTSVFTEESGNSGPRLPGALSVVEPPLQPGAEYKVAPAKGVRPVPVYSRRAQLGREILKGGNRAFNRNIANRLWAMVMGRGLVDPVDLQHTGNPPAHPAVLELLADEIVARQFDLRSMIRELALTEAYQQSLTLPEALTRQADAIEQQFAELQATGQQLEEAAKQSDVAYALALEKARATRTAVAPLYDEAEKARAAIDAPRKAAEAAAKALADAETAHQSKQPLAVAVAAAAEAAQQAAAQLPGEKEVAQAAATFAARAKKLAAEVAALTKTIEANKPKAEATAKALAALQPKLQEVTKKIDGEKPKTMEADRELMEAAGKRRQDLIAARRAAKRLELAKTLSMLAKQKTAYATALTAANKGRRDLVQADQSLASLTKQRPVLQAAVAAAEAELASARTAVVDTQNQLASKQAAAKQSATALAQAEAAPQPVAAERIAELRKQREMLDGEVEALDKARTGRQQKMEQAAAKLASAQQSLADNASQETALQQQRKSIEAKSATASAAADAAQGQADEASIQVTAGWTEQFAAAALKPLSPEQMAWSLMKLGGLIDRQQAASAAELNKKSPLSEADKQDKAKVAARERQISDAAREKLSGNVKIFVTLFGAGAGQPQNEFFATVDQALFFSNGGQVRSWLSPSGGNLTARLNKTEDPRQLAEEMYLGVLTRQPSAEELADVTAYLSSRGADKSAAIQEMVWALVTSTEFRFNH